MRLPFFSPQLLVGLDIQPHEIRLIQLKKYHSQYRVLHSASTGLPEGVCVDGKIREREIFQNILTRLVISAGVMHRHAIICLPAYLVRMQSLSLPKEMSRQAVKSSIQNQFSRDFPAISSAICMDFYVLPTDSVDYVEVFFVAARKDDISQYVQAVNASGLVVKIVDVDIYALKRFVDWALQLVSTANLMRVVLYESDFAITMLAYSKDEILYYQHWNSLGENEFNAELNNQLTIISTMFGELTVEQLVVCSANFFRQSVGCVDKNFKITQIDPLSVFSFDKTLESLGSPHKFLLACGLAMREV